MVKKRGLWYALKYYNIIHYFITGVILIFMTQPVIQFICDLQGLYKRDWIYKLYQFGVPVLFIFLFLLTFLTSVRRKKYFYITGRDLKADSRKYKRSYSELVEYFTDPYQIDADSLPDISWKEAEGVILGKAKNERLFHIPSSKDGKNYFIFGLPSSGKTAGIIIPTCLRFGMKHPFKSGIGCNDNSICNSNAKEKSFGSVFCIDLKNDIWNATHHYRNIKRFNLMDKENSCHYNPFAGVESLSIDERCNFIENIGFNIIEESSGGDGQYFTNTAHDYWNGIALYMLHNDIHTSFPEIVKAVLAGNAVDWVKTVVNSGCEEAKRRLQSKWGENEKNLSGGYSKLAQCVRKFASDTLFFLLGNEPGYEYISPQMLEDGYDCYIQLDQADIMNFSPLLSMITQGFLNGFLKRELNVNAGRLEDGTLRPILMCLDEFAQLKALKYDCVATAFMTLRSKNVSILCALQSRSSISEMFHSENACMSLIDCVTTFCFLSIQEVATREWASKLIGTKKVLHISNSVNEGSHGKSNAGKSIQETTEPIIPEAEFGNLIDRMEGRDELIIYSQGKYLKADKQYYFR